ncbi:MAG TPA: type II secretion system F family protein [bacterium]|nr:type II secretion system F family protein [bacterium]
MPKYAFVVRDPSGKTISGQLAMNSREELISRLKDQGYYISKVNEVKEGNVLTNLDTAFARLTPIKLKDIAILARLLSVMINAGLPILRSLKIVEKQTENLRLVEVVQSVRDYVEEGHALSYAMGKHPSVFNSLIVAMVKAGEESGSLDIVLDRIAKDLEREIEIRANVQAGVRYPVIVMVAACIIVTLVLYFVVPQFQEIFEDMDAKLPLPTMMLVKASEVVRFGTIYVVMGVFALMAFFKIGRKYPPVEKMIDKFMLKLPVFGMLLRKIALARFSRTLAILLSSGVPILRALSVVEQTVGNAVISNAVAGAKEAIREGERIAPPLEETGEFPPMVVDMIAVGEETGALDTMLAKVSDFYDREVDYTIDAFTTLIEPLLIVVLGVVIGFIVVALYLPMFSIIQQLGDSAAGGSGNEGLGE